MKELLSFCSCYFIGLIENFTVAFLVCIIIKVHLVKYRNIVGGILVELKEDKTEQL